MTARKSQTAARTDAINDYEALDVIGSGTFGLIRKVRRISDGRIFARKELQFERMTDRDRRQICAEVNILRTLHHTNIVRYEERGIDNENGILYIVMEYCEGGDLGSTIKRCKKTNTQLDEDVVWSYLAQMVLALHECHYRGSNTSRDSAILHRDLKPENVFLDGQKNIIKIGDFGLSKEVAALDFARTYVGTPYYMSPELATGAPYDAKSDIWALGCVAYELCALAPPFDANDQQELTRKIKLGNVPRLPKAYSGQLGDVIRSMLELNPKHRPTTRDLLQHGKIANALQALELLAWSGRMAEEREKLRMQWEELDEGRRILAEREAAVCHGELEWRRRKSELEDRERRVEEREQKMTTWEQETASAAALPNHHRGAPASTHQEPAPTRPALRPGNRRVSSGGIPRLRSSPAISSEAGNGASHVVEVVHVRSHGTPRSTRDRSRYGVRPLLGGVSRQREESNGGDEWVEDGEFGSGSGSASSTGSTSDDVNVEVSNVAVAENSREDSPSTSISSSSVKASSRPAASSATSTMARRQNSQSSSHDSETTSVRPSARRSARVSQVSPAMRAWIQQTQASSSEDQDMTMRDASQMMEDKENHNQRPLRRARTHYRLEQ
ncbi:kinase-like protein [Acaromyces ingoldii]|uniref:non-specific serine/threonine protein kinase n=1 Tax=Acaromyces ingoldii TaxID=215250 RepID=A0A316YNB2_9BASI|nr:kinase-like protein [Acaromyces ingoldii]PWN90701.1 kinase-like protein [Acaromyces ingoldii]